MTVILCNGKFPEHSIPLGILDNARQIICCDGATVKLLNHGKTPHAIVGDLDSLPEQYREKFSKIIHLDTCQETNDLTKAVEWCVKQGVKKLVILGGTGLREDHSIANTALLVDYAKKLEIKMLTDTGTFYPLIKSQAFESYAGQSISIFAITPQSKITSTGLKYEVTSRKFLNWNEGTLNTALGNSFKIEFDFGKLLLFKEF